MHHDRINPSTVNADMAADVFGRWVITVHPPAHLKSTSSPPQAHQQPTSSPTSAHIKPTYSPHQATFESTSSPHQSHLQFPTHRLLLQLLLQFLLKQGANKLCFRPPPLRPSPPRGVNNSCPPPRPFTPSPANEKDIRYLGNCPPRPPGGQLAKRQSHPPSLTPFPPPPPPHLPPPNPSHPPLLSCVDCLPKE